MLDLYKTVTHINNLPVIKIDLIDFKVDPKVQPLMVKSHRPSLDFKLPI